jgi:hypothetical protein
MKTFAMLLVVTLLSACGSLHLQIQVVDPQVTADRPGWTTALTSPTPCPIAFFFGALPNRCPDEEAKTLEAAFQMFDGGYMLWESGSSSVYILYNDGSYVLIEGDVINAWPEAPVLDLPPPNHFKPMRGFSRVWMHEAPIRDNLGWPFGIEQAFTTQFQHSTESNTGERFLYMTLPNSQIIEFSPDGSWQVIR